MPPKTPPAPAPHPLDSILGTADPAQQAAIVKNMISRLPQDDAILVVTQNARTGRIAVTPIGEMRLDTQQALLNAAALDVSGQLARYFDARAAEGLAEQAEQAGA